MSHLPLVLATTARSFLYVLTPGGFDSSVHISEEASNARVVVPWAMVSTVSIAGVLGWGTSLVASGSKRLSREAETDWDNSAQCCDRILHGHRPRVDLGKPYWPAYGDGKHLLSRSCCLYVSLSPRDRSSSTVLGVMEAWPSGLSLSSPSERSASLPHRSVANPGGTKVHGCIKPRGYQLPQDGTKD